MVNQIEYHPGFTQKECVEFCQKNNILVEAWSPLGRGNVLDNPLLKSIAANHNKSVAQVVILVEYLFLRMLWIWWFLFWLLFLYPKKESYLCNLCCVDTVYIKFYKVKDIIVLWLSKKFMQEKSWILVAILQ